MTTRTARPNLSVQRGLIDRWALTGWDLRDLRKSHGVAPGRVAEHMNVSMYRVEQLEGQRRVTRATVLRYLAAVDHCWRNPPAPMSAERILAMNEQRDARMQAARERSQQWRDDHRQERDQEHEHREHWPLFVRAFKTAPVAAFCEHCLEVTDEPQPDDVGQALADLYERQRAEHHVVANLAALVRELEHRAWFVRAGSVEVLVQVRDRPQRGHRPAPPRMGTARRPAYDVFCRLTPFGKRLMQSMEHGAA